MKPIGFEYVAPQSLEEMLDILDDRGDDARILAGGQSLGPLLNLRLALPDLIVDANRVGGLDHIDVEDGGWLTIGAMTRQRAAEVSPVIRRGWPLLHTAIGQIGHRAIRNRGTVGGSVAHADPAAELPAALTALDAEIVLAGRTTRREVAAREFFRGPFTTAVGRGEALVAVRVPPTPRRTAQVWLEFSRRYGDFGIAGVAALMRLSDVGNVADARLVYSGVDWTPWEDEGTAALIGHHPTSKLIMEVAATAAAAADPPSDVHASGAYRRRLVKVLAERALEACAAAASRDEPA